MCKKYIVHICLGFRVLFILPLFAQDVTIYDCMVIMPANRFVDESYGDLLQSPETITLVRTAAREGLALYATCAGVRVLAAARVLNGVHVTGRFEGEYEWKQTFGQQFGHGYDWGNSVSPVRDDGYFF